jgi:glycosyltransferase involved in cell wall biosynthesis
MESLARAHGVAPVRIPIGIDASQWPAARPAEGPPWRLLQVASLNRVKDQTTLVRAIARVRRQVDIRLDLVGEDTLDGRLAHEAAAVGIADLVRFHGFVPHHRLPAFYRAAHLYVQTSLHEGGGVSVLEAAASGVPIVGTPVGYVNDWAPDAALTVPAGDAEALAEAIARAIASPESGRTHAARARAFVVEHDLDVTARALTDLYSGEIARRR